MTSYVHDMHLALQNNLGFSVVQNDELKVEQHNFLSWLYHSINPAYHHENVATIAEVLAKSLRDAPRALSIKTALSDEKVACARLFLKQEKGRIDPRIDELQKELLAFKLGVAAGCLDLPVNSGFSEFAANPPLERYLFEYHHKLEVNYITGEIQIMANSQYQPWSKAKKIVAKKPASKPQQRWLYGSQGLQNEDMYVWQKLKPYKKGDPATWNHQYIFEFCACCSDNPNKTGDHSWIRLKTPDGDIYSVGLYRPGKQGLSDNYKFPLRIKKGHLMQPDVSEFWPMDHFKIPIAITEDEFLQMKQQIEEDKRRDEETFQLFHGNCTLYAAKIAKIAHIKLPTAKPVWRIIFSKPVQAGFDALSAYTPECIQNVVNAIVGVFFNFLQLLFGASIVDHEVRLTNTTVQPHIANIWDLFNPAKSNLNHPNTLGKDTRDYIFGWRSQEKRRLEDLKAAAQADEIRRLENEIQRVRFNIPTECRKK